LNERLDFGRDSKCIWEPHLIEQQDVSWNQRFGRWSAMTASC